ncbi:MAG TPA: DUF5939 domain-containing protein [Spirochaetota bacterium]|nr:DUF5939 domain-containing protein [Spirochaetota bacterium]
MTLSDYLQNNPWPEKWLTQGAPVDYLFTYDVNASVDGIWPHLTDTSAINRALGLSRMKFSEKGGRLFGENRMGGMLQQWEEVPWEWEYGKEMRAERIYSRGIARYVRVRYGLEPAPGNRCRIVLYLGWIPRDSKGALLLKAARGTVGRRFGRVFAGMAGKAAKPIEFSIAELPSLKTGALKTGADSKKIAAIHERLRGELPGNESLDRFISYINAADDGELYRMRPVAMARALQLDFNALLGTMLHATRAGLLNLSWDSVCPHCRGVRGRTEHLWDIAPRENCAVCGIDFDATGLNGIEVSFRINPEIKKVAEVLYCSAEPSKKSHILIQKPVPAGQIRTADLFFGAGVYRLRVGGRKMYNLLEVRELNRQADITWNEKDDGEQFETAPGAALRMKNGSINDLTFIVERDGEDQDALRPRHLFNFQDFRDLFSKEFLSLGLSLDVGVQNVMFIDVVRSSALYNREGNSRAFAIMRAFFSKGHEIAKRYNGAIIKTMGDALLLSFGEPLSALKAAGEFTTLFDGTDREAPVETRITINRGPCLAVNLNSSIDYFGQPVNVVAKLQQYAGAGDIVVTGPFIEDPSVHAYLSSKKFNFDRSKKADVKGVGEVAYWTIRMKIRRRPENAAPPEGGTP